MVDSMNYLVESFMIILIRFTEMKVIIVIELNTPKIRILNKNEIIR